MKNKFLMDECIQWIRMTGRRGYRGRNLHLGVSGAIPPRASYPYYCVILWRLAGSFRILIIFFCTHVCVCVCVCVNLIFVCLSFIEDI